ncbi:type III pantothenate kinase [Pseudomarimonas arenosa]|uniref:Type III pantothenate kinase n=1 Tax=Pseudomarimonas arenosa TaxID=2774145 RepID=A0AAW3ZP36_9GAMM|nr:type III pantothenate kinase [Pseudomarimonas arenosa]MBD8527943.1 type III pantothenate kinase [Pseudomarimonas arenosa]
MLLIDFGNTRVKWARWREGQLLAPLAQAYDDPALAADLEALSVAEQPGLRVLRYASVTAPHHVQFVLRPLRAAGFECWRAGPPRSDGLLQLAYQPLDDLGVDRWLSLRALRARGAGSFVLACAGTALTIDVVDAEGRHLGGTIAPSVDRAREALLARAPHLAKSAAEVELLAQSTASAVHSGAVLGAVALIEKLHRHAEARCAQPLPLYLSGGGADLLRHWLQSTVQTVEHLVLEGLAGLRPGDSLAPAPIQ